MSFTRRRRWHIKNTTDRLNAYIVQVYDCLMLREYLFCNIALCSHLFDYIISSLDNVLNSGVGQLVTNITTESLACELVLLGEVGVCVCVCVCVWICTPLLSLDSLIYFLLQYYISTDAKSECGNNHPQKNNFQRCAGAISRSYTVWYFPCTGINKGTCSVTLSVSLCLCGSHSDVLL